jgi:hypothetical protein
MTLRSPFWHRTAGVFFLINVGGLPLAVAMGEPRHALLHVGLIFVGYLAWRVTARRDEPVRPQIVEPDPRLEYLQQSVDAIALEVERIGEAQRFNEKLRAKDRTD